MDKAVYYPGCFVNYYDPRTGQALVEVLEGLGLEVVVPKQLCCGIPMLANANLKGARKRFEELLRVLNEASEGGHPVVTTCPSCSLMLKKEGPEFFPELKGEVPQVLDVFELLLQLQAEGRLGRPWGRLERRVFYHNPCHARAQGLTRQTLQVIRQIPGLEVVGTSFNCCGMGGSYGMKAVNFERSTFIARKVWGDVKASGVQTVVTECGGCGLQIGKGTGAEVFHPLLLVRDAMRTEGAGAPQQNEPRG